MRGGYRWRALLTGSIRVLVRTRRTAAVITALAAAGVPLWNVERAPEGFLATLPTERRAPFYAVLRRYRARPRVMRRTGLLRALRRVSRRPALVGGLVMAAVAVFAFASRIYVVDAPDAGPGLERPVLAAAARAGVYPGALRSRVDVPAVEHDIQTGVPGLSWVGVNIYGGLVLIRIHRVTAPVKPSHANRLVAAEAGVVRQVSVYAGQAVVAPGDRVLRGSPLILGQVVVPPNQGSEAGAPATRVAAGSVLADVTVSARATVPLVQHQEVKTGRHYVRTWLEVGSWSTLTSGFPPVPFPRYTVHSRSTRVIWRGVRLPAYELTVVYNEAIVRTRRIRPKEASHEAETRAMKELAQKFRPGARLVSRRVQISTKKTAVTAAVEVVVQENIAEPNAPAGGGT